MHTNTAAPSRLIRWFDPRYRSIGTWAFILNRVTALGLTLYLFLHLVMLGQLAMGPEQYNAFIKFAGNPVVKVGELLVIAAGFIHGLNGIRVALTSFGVAATRQRSIFVVLLALALAATAFFLYKMYFGE